MKTKTATCLLAVLSSDYDVIIFTETFLDKFINDSELFGNNYLVYRCDRSPVNSNKLSGGGVLVAIASKLSSVLVSFVIEPLTEEIWVSLAVGLNKLFIGGVYIPPSMPVDKYKDHIKNTTDVCSRLNINDSVIVIGDYNLPNINWIPDNENIDNNEMFPTNILNCKDIIIIDGMIT